MAGHRSDQSDAMRDVREALLGGPTERVRTDADHLTYEQLAALVDGDIDDVNREIAAVHLDVCPHCAAELKDLQELKAGLPPGVSPPKPAAPVWWTFPRLAAAAVVVLAAGALVWGLWNARQRSEATSSPGVAANIPAASPDPSEPARSPKILMTLKDAGGDVTLDEDGNLSGPGALATTPVGAAVKAALTLQRLNMAPALEGLRGAPGVLMGESQRGESFGPTTPVGTAVLADRPTFRWRPLPGASSYVVTVYDTRYTPVAHSTPQPTTEWTMPSSLGRGAIYLWQVTATRNGAEVTSPVAPAPEARFRVLSRDQAAEVERAVKEHATSHLALGTVYANAGLLSDAARELQLVVDANPDSDVAKALLREVRSATARR